ncbi:MAG: 2-C-methyl-D-erythritol 2,4-cyclodiphosphate synthase [Planctomycetes bacterium]|nr:2-C-methyl-D-erythritol 2,4-cyclodiphosphate synthase [Planctomycetota bacterium]
MRVGIGYDIHRFGADRALRLGGVEIPEGEGLEGWSDADCLLHAICDALLGAAGLGDIGQHFPNDDPEYRGADSIDLLGKVSSMVARAGYRVVNVDSTVLAEEPPLAHYRDAMKRRIAGALSISPDAVGVKFGTNERLGAIGRMEGIAAQAVCLIEKRAGR